ncbi:MAG: hypothetical protein CVV27_08150 [Candidatus Melainabacteria bacterium HGW-Melainabacteria-1]|nr:MAG: hypothetical protein CVV27_08150 [Candidatus Melainabacteria bacterium HGW-Melainabacteria-1]
MIQNRLTRRLAQLLCVGLLSACASMPPPELPADDARQRQLAANFIQALFSKQTEAVMASAGHPFYMNHQAILSYPDELRRVLAQLFSNSQVTPVEILEIQPLDSLQFEAQRPNDLARLFEYGFDGKLYWLLSLKLMPAGGQPQFEKVLLLLDPNNGKVVGFIQSR